MAQASLTELTLTLINATNEPLHDSPDGYRTTLRVARVQILIALFLGCSAFLVFSVLRVKYPKIYVANFHHVNQNYLHSISRQNLPQLPRTLFGWVPVVFLISEDQVLEHAGLDAVVFLGFFKMCIQTLAICVAFAVVVISPIRYKFTGRMDLPDPGDDHGNATASFLWDFFKPHLPEDGYEKFLWMYTVFTYVFTFVIAYMLFRQTNKIIAMRQTYLGKQNSVTDRTIKLLGIPPVLRDEEDLKRHINSLGIGHVEAVVVVKEWNSLNRLFQMREHVLRQTEIYWLEYFERNGIRNKNDMLASNLHPNVGALYNMYDEPNTEETTQPYRDEPEETADTTSHSIIDNISEHIENDIADASSDQLPLLNDELFKRPKKRKGWLGLFGPEIDAINYCTEQLDVIDKEISRARTREYPPSSTAFITMKTTIQAQMFAQAVLDPKVSHMITSLAPAPHDIIWDNLCLTRRERNTRIFLVTVFIGLISILSVYPVSFLTNFLKIKSISKVLPALGKYLEAHKWAETLVTGILPPYVFTIFNVVMPYFYIWISSKQGYTSHSDEELSTVSKNFFYIFVNLFLVFTLFGTASLSDTTKIAYQLADSLKGLSLFYVDLIILQGIGMFPYKLLLLGNLVLFPLGSAFWCKTPRDFLKLYKPPVFNFGLQLPQPILVLIITITYSVISTKILTAGLIYFLIGYFVFKYQLLYACVHPPHSSGKVWPLVFRRVVLGLLIFQLTMAGTLALEKAYDCAFVLSPLPLITLAFLWNFQNNYIPLSIFIALRSIENNNVPFADDDEEPFIQTSEATRRDGDRSRTLDERRELNTTYEYPHLIGSLDGPVIAIDRNEILLVNSDGHTVRKGIPAFTGAWD